MYLGYSSGDIIKHSFKLIGVALRCCLRAVLSLEKDVYMRFSKHQNSKSSSSLSFNFLFDSVVVDPIFLALCVSHYKGKTHFYFEKPFLENGLESLIIFVLF